MIHLKNSTDLNWAPGARSIGEEFFECIILVTKIWPRKVLSLHKVNIHIGSATQLTCAPFSQDSSTERGDAFRRTRPLRARRSSTTIYNWGPRVAETV